MAQLDCDPQHANEPVDLRGIPVLIVDDNATNRRVLTGMLRNWGMRPRAVAERAGSPSASCGGPSRPDGRIRLLLVDAMMPDMDGFSLLEELAPDAGTGSCDHHDADLGGSPDRRGPLPAARVGLLPRQTGEVERAQGRGAIGIERHPRGTPVSASPPDDAEPASHAESQRPLRILLVEDNLVNQRVALELLEKHGHQISAVGNGKEALAALDRDNFDAVFMDVQMPEMNGFEATQAIRAGEAGTDRHLPSSP